MSNRKGLGLSTFVVVMATWCGVVLVPAGLVVAAEVGPLLTAPRDSVAAPGDALGQSCTTALNDDRRTIERSGGSLVGGSFTALLRCTYSTGYGTVMDVDDDDFVASVAFVERSGTCVYGDECGDGSNQELYCSATHSRIDDGTVDGYFEIVLQGVTCSGSFPSGGAIVDVDRMFVSSGTIGGNGNNVCSYRTASAGSFGRCHQAAWDSFLSVAPEWHWIEPIEGLSNLCGSITPSFDLAGVPLATLTGETANAGQQLKLTVTVGEWDGEPGDVRILMRANKLNGDSAPLRTFDFLNLDDGSVQAKTFVVAAGGIELSTVEMSCHYDGQEPQWWLPGDGPFGGDPSPTLGRACGGMGWVWPDRDQLLDGETVVVRFRLGGNGATNFLASLHLDVEGEEGLLNFDPEDSGTYLLEIEEATPPSGGAPIAVSSISYQHHGSGWFTASWEQPTDGATEAHGIWCTDAQGSVLYQFDGSFVGSDGEGSEQCFGFGSMSLTSPSSWLRGLGDMGVCLLTWLFVPTKLDAKFDEFQTAVFDQFPFSMVAGAADFLGTLGNEMESAAGTGCWSGSGNWSFGEYGTVAADDVCIGDNVTVDTGARQRVLVLMLAPMVWGLLRYTWAVLFGGTRQEATA